MKLELNKDNISIRLDEAITSANMMETMCGQVITNNKVMPFSFNSLKGLFMELGNAVNNWKHILTYPNLDIRAKDRLDIDNFTTKLTALRDAAIPILQWFKDNYVSADGSIKAETVNMTNYGIDTKVINPGDIDDLIILLENFRGTMTRG